MLPIQPTLIENFRPAVDADEDAIDLGQYWRLLRKYWLGIFSFVVAVSLLSMPVIYSLVPIYKATTTMVIESQGGNVVSIEEIYGLQAGKDYYHTQLEVLRSRSLAKRVVERLQLADNPDFILKKKPLLGFDWRSMLPGSGTGDVAPVLSPEASLSRAVNYLRGHVEIRPVANSRLVHVNFISHNPELAADISRAIAEEYIDSDLESRLQMTQKASGWLTQRLASLKDELKQSEQRLQQYKVQENMVDARGVKERLLALNTNLMTARQQLAESEALSRQVRKARKQGSSRLDALPSTLNHSQVQAYKREVSTTQRKVSELSKRYGPKHPKMIQANANLKDAKSLLYQQMQDVVGSVEREHEVARIKVQKLQLEVEAAKKDIQNMDNKNYQLDVLQKEVEANHNLYDLFLTRFKETSETRGIESANARILDPAVVPGGPFKPNKRRILNMVILSSLLFAIGIVLLLDRLDNTIKSSAELEEKVRLPVLGILPRLQTKGKRDISVLRAFLDDDQTAFAESVRTIRTGVVLSSLDDEHKIVLVTSSVPGEGKSTTAMNLAHAMSHMSKTLLIDADMRRPSIAMACDLGQHPKGLSQYAAGTANISEAVYEILGTKLHVMPAGIIPPNPLELLSSKKFELALDKLSEVFDHVVIDSAPAMAVSDSLVLSRHAQAVIYVVKADSTPLPVVKTGIKRLLKVEANLIGAVLNMPAGNRTGGYGYHGDYYSDYTYGYGKSS